MTRRGDIAEAVRLDGGWRETTVTMWRGTGDSTVVVDGWSYSLEGGGQLGGSVRMHLERFVRRPDGVCDVVERAPKSGEVFPSAARADAYALNCGALRWYSELRGARLVAAASEAARLLEAMCRVVDQDPELGDVLATGYPFASSLDEVAHQVAAWCDAMDHAVRASSRGVVGAVCPACQQPGHASETDDAGYHPACLEKLKGITA